MTAAQTFGLICFIACVAAIFVDKRNLSMRMTVSELRAKMTRPTPTVRALEVLALVSGLLSSYAAIKGW